MELRTLRSRRKAAFWGKVLPFLPYVFQSGVAVLLLLLMIAFSAWYTAFLQQIPPGLPIRWILLALWGPLTVYAGFRTYAQPADVIFLLPQETKISAYLAPAFRNGLIFKLIGLYIVVLLAWPLYQRGGGIIHPLWLMLLVLLLLKALSTYGAWQEQRITGSRARAGFRYLRWCFILLMTAAWIWQPAWKSALFMALVSLNYVLILRFPMKYKVPWDNLIAAERSSAARVMLVLGWFVDVPAEGQKVIRRRWLSGVGNGIPWQPAEAYRYLLVKTFVRSELLGIVLRLTLLGMVLAGWNDKSWLGPVLYLLFVFLAGTQLASLRQEHRDSPAASFYPLPAGARKAAALRLCSRLLLAITVLLWLPMAVIPGGDAVLTFGSLAAGLLLAFGLRSNWARKWREEEDDE
ncbi:MAG: ABC transporter permease [Paenibacillaceae bacterium]|uniref:ABC transporter permease n=1 Tax=Paenibacillus mellifer TaxID=2937794 RepID=A0A9X2BVF2_9BACL|nr:ABC transporter permease [Paenibacillus mellifer]MBW4841471.1 ABC transporter permease [Paenibacillaceae bacterium]MCK8490116.1 ABC transporter permease [Paenibacillus mellifer]